MSNQEPSHRIAGMSTFANTLIQWQKQHGRHSLPWQGTNDPYAIWVAEVMLQQTQVMTVIPYYQRFLEAFPDIECLAEASIDTVLTLWSGLGYYSRGRNLHKAACLMTEHPQGRFPQHAAEIAQLPGIGRSTAAAIAAFAYGERCAILDGNVKRVFARYFGITGYPGEKKTEALLWQKAEALLPEGNAATTNGCLYPGTDGSGRNRVYASSAQMFELSIAAGLRCFREHRVASLPTPKPRKPLPSKETTFLVLIDQGQDFT